MIKLVPIYESEDKNKPLYQSPECQELISIYPDFYKSFGFNPPWIGYFIIKDEKVVGSCGFKGQPLYGKIEIAYWTFKDFEKQGIAKQACKALVELTLKTNPDLIISAQTLPEENASTSILKQNGFELAGMAHDEDAGEVWEWIYKK